MIEDSALLAHRLNSVGPSGKPKSGCYAQGVTYGFVDPKDSTKMIHVRNGEIVAPPATTPAATLIRPDDDEE